MDLTEKLFHYFIQKKHKTSQLEIEKKSIPFSDYEQYVVTILNYFIPDLNIEIRASDQYVGLIGQSFVLPRFYYAHSEAEYNQRCLKYLIFYQAFLIEHQLVTKQANLSLQLKTIESLCYRPFILKVIQKRFPSYFSEIQELESYILHHHDLHGLEKNIFQELMNLPLVNDNHNIAQALEQCRSSFQSYQNKMKQNGEFKGNIWKTWGFVPDNIPRLKLDVQAVASTRQRSDATEPMTEIEKKDTLQAEHVDLEKEKKSANPVTHSFEKLETADEYNGGYRIDSGDDELNDHQAALDELNLKKVTRGGESAQSIYRADLLPQLFFNENRKQSIKQNQILLPEWSSQQQKYLQDYCQLEIRPELDLQQTDFKETILLKYQNQIDLWKKQIDRLFNVYGWKNRQFDGTEIDIDSFIRASIEMKLNLNSDQRLYMQQFKMQQDFAVTILLDQSMSSDSWVNDRRILDVSLESIGVLGFLFKDIIQNLSIQTTFSHGHQTCFLQKIKSFDEDWDCFYQRAKMIQPQGYTRLGPGIRYCLAELNQLKAKHKLLIMLTDGRPTDIDGYEGLYGIQDIHQAMLEAKQKNIHTYALTIDKEAKNYFSKMFQHYHVLQSPDQLAEKLFLYLSQILKTRS